MGLGWDEELPAGYQDADLEQAEYERQANEAINDNNPHDGRHAHCEKCREAFLQGKPEDWTGR